MTPLPRTVDDPPYFLLWRMDDFAPPTLMLAIGFLLDAPFFMAFLGLVLAAHLYAGLPPPGLKLEVLWQHTLRVCPKQHAEQQESVNTDKQENNSSCTTGCRHEMEDKSYNLQTLQAKNMTRSTMTI